MSEDHIYLEFVDELGPVLPATDMAKKKTSRRPRARGRMAKRDTRTRKPAKKKRRRRRNVTPKPPPAFVGSYTALSGALGVSRGMLSKYLELGAPPKGSDGYEVAAWRRWMDLAAAGDRAGEDRRAGVAGVGAAFDLSPEARTARLRNVSAQASEREARAELAALDLARRRGELILVSEMKRRDVARVQVVKRGLYNLAQRAAVELAGVESAEEAEHVLRRHVNALLERFASM